MFLSKILKNILNECEKNKIEPDPKKIGYDIRRNFKIFYDNILYKKK